MRMGLMQFDMHVHYWLAGMGWFGGLLVARRFFEGLSSAETPHVPEWVWSWWFSQQLFLIEQHC